MSMGLGKYLGLDFWMSHLDFWLSGGPKSGCLQYLGLDVAVPGPRTKISGSWGGGTNPDKDFPVMSKILMSDSNLLNSLITKRYSLDEINLAIEDLSLGRVFRPLIEMEH